MEQKIIKQGYVVITPTVCQGDVMAWSSQKQGEDVFPLVFDTIKEARLEQLEELEEEIRQYKEEERDWDDINWDLREEFIARYTEFENGVIQVRYLDGENSSVFIETTLEKWRDDR